MQKHCIKDPEFYTFTRRLEAYRKLLGLEDMPVLDGNAEFFRYLMSQGQAGEAKGRRDQHSSAPRVS